MNVYNIKFELLRFEFDEIHSRWRGFASRRKLDLSKQIKSRFEDFRHLSSRENPPPTEVFDNLVNETKSLIKDFRLEMSVK